MKDPRFDNPVSDLRRRMLQDMTNRNLGDKTRHGFFNHLETLTRATGRTPDTATAHELRQVQADQIEQGTQPPKVNSQA